MRQILDYQIVTADNPDALQYEVKDQMRHGWQPLGPMFPVCGSYETVDSSFIYYHQTLVIYGGKMED